MSSQQNVLGSVVALWRYPVKSMMGEELDATEVTRTGLLGDRAYALVDGSDGKVASAKNPRKWPHMFDCRAALADTPQVAAKTPPARITLPDGTILRSDQPEVHAALSQLFARQVSLSALPEARVTNAEAYWPDMEGLKHRDTVTDFRMPVGTFFDSAFVHVLSTATLDRLRELYPQGRFEARRFRPNIVLDTGDGEKDFVEDAWVGKAIAIGDSLRLCITACCPRCVMTTLAQGDLPADAGILRAAAQHHKANVGVYASVLQAGRVRRGDSAHLE